MTPIFLNILILYWLYATQQAKTKLQNLSTITKYGLATHNILKQGDKSLKKKKKDEFLAELHTF